MGMLQRVATRGEALEVDEDKDADVFTEGKSETEKKTKVQEKKTKNEKALKKRQAAEKAKKTKNEKARKKRQAAEKATKTKNENALKNTQAAEKATKTKNEKAKKSKTAAGQNTNKPAPAPGPRVKSTPGCMAMCHRNTKAWHLKCAYKSGACDGCTECRPQSDTIYVSATEGSDSNDGFTESTPLQSVKAGVDATVTSRCLRGDTCTLALSGLFRLEETVNLANAHSNLIIDQWSGEEAAVLSGGQVVDSWTEEGDGVWSAPLTTDQVNALSAKGMGHIYV